MRESESRIGAALKAAREDAGLSQLSLGRLIGVTRQQIRKYETGADRLPVSRALSIAEALNVPVTAIIGSEEAPRAQPGRFIPSVGRATPAML